MIDRVICGWRVRSLLPLPETMPWSGPDRPVDVEIRPGAVPDRLGPRSADLPYIEAAPDGRLLVDVMPIGRFLVTPDCVVVDTTFARDAPEWRAFLLGPVLAVLCYLRGALPLHAAALRVGDRTIALAGRSGSGKSTLAAALSGRGHALITDDICACVGLSESPLLLPTYPALKLSRVSLDALGIDPTNLVAIGPDFEKRQVIRPQGFNPAPVALDAVYLIEDAPEGAADEIVPTTGADAFTRLSAEIYRPPIGRLLLTKPTFFGMATRLATEVATRRLLRRPDFTRLQTLMDMIEADAAP